ncbi:hypothetical protein [Kineosporia babensis]|uniref:Uncharacterized protein n=1 Tax=Kineosporia babensis TaxID=499548 RepID=A0A9X1NAD3_9ACTN|nr:hypothetical protein [Kineosporia babensis]MCD5310460.1 hypothetical protein [Kineosporia babensis]
MDQDKVQELLNTDLTPLMTEENLEVNKTVRLSLAMTQAIEAEAKRQGVKPSALMRRWIEDGLSRSAGQPNNLSVPLEELLRVVQQLARPAAA